MLKTRIITAIVLLSIIFPILFLGSFNLVVLFCAVFCAASFWESLRLFQYRGITLATAVWTGLFVWLALTGTPAQFMFIWVLGCLAWMGKFIPSLKWGLPSPETISNRLSGMLYLVSVLACFLAILVFQRHSPVYLLSVMAIIWVADIGAYFFGKAFGKHKLAPAISPGKSWEGAIGGWLCVMLLGIFSAQLPFLSDTFSASLKNSWGWTGLCLVLTLLTAASVAGDLVESQLKRRAQVKDSSQLLPGHGGVLDRIDALILTMPLAILIESVMKLTHITNS